MPCTVAEARGNAAEVQVVEVRGGEQAHDAPARAAGNGVMQRERNNRFPDYT